MATQLIDRNSKGLVEALFASIDALNERKIEPEHARALAHTARTIVGIAALELEYMRFQKENDGRELKSLAITSEQPTDAK